MYTLYLSIHLFYSLSAYYAQYTNTDEWTLYNAQCNVNVHNTFIVDTWYSLIQYSIQFTVYSSRYIQYTYTGCPNILYSLQFTVYTIYIYRVSQYSIQFTVYGIYNIHIQGVSIFYTVHSLRYIQYTYTGFPNILYSSHFTVYTIYIYRVSQYSIEFTDYGICNIHIQGVSIWYTVYSFLYIEYTYSCVRGGSPLAPSGSSRRGTAPPPLENTKLKGN